MSFSQFVCFFFFFFDKIRMSDLEKYDSEEEYDDYDDYLDDELNENDMWDNATGGEFPFCGGKEKAYTSCRFHKAIQ